MFETDNIQESGHVRAHVTIGPVIGGDLDPADFPEINPDDLPILPLRSEVLFPFSTVPVPVGRESSLMLLEEAVANDTAIFVVTQQDPSKDNPGARDLYRVGEVAKVLRVLDLPDGSKTAVLFIGQRARLKRVVRRQPYLRGAVEVAPEIMPDPTSKRLAVVLHEIDTTYAKILDLMGEDETRELKFALSQIENPLKKMHFMCANSPLDVRMKEELLAIDELEKRAEAFARMLNTSYDITQLRIDVQKRTHQALTDQQREHFLREQIRTMQDELGGMPEEEDEDELRGRAQEKKWPEWAAVHFEKELRKLERYNVQNPEYSVQYGYLDALLKLPWDDYSPSEVSVKAVAEALDRDHYGLEKVKERIVEHMAVLQLRADMKAPILCLYGPPGVGKTSLGKSVAEALGREYARISLGGLHDEAEIRGHRRTYIGAMPGRIIAALQKVGKGNPVFVLDEIDKIGRDMKGDPSTALLEVLDPEQNNKFHDNYIDVDYDLSKVLFIATANDLSGVSRPLLDRMELVEVGGYITAEKVEIAKRHLLPKQLEEHGLARDEVEFTDAALQRVIDRYTRESGVRLLEKTLAKAIRKIARAKAAGEEYLRVVDFAAVETLLGAEEVTPDEYETDDYIGVVTGLAWTQVGGEILFIEVSLAPGKGEKLTLTGNLGDVMKESATLAMQYLKAHADELGIDRQLLAERDVHIHVPEGAIPKDGPSAGITMLTALASAFSGRKVRPRLAMTGEITLRGKVLPVGGIKEKILAAKRAGITTVMLCEANRKDIEKIPSQYLEGMDFHYVKNMKEVLDFALI